MVAISILTPLMGLGTAVDADNARTYLAVTLVAALTALDGHNHALGSGLPTARVPFGLAAARPAFGHPGNVYFATDTGRLSLDTGAAWTDYSSAVAETLTNKTIDSAANTMTMRNAALASDVARPNLIVNGGLNVWQRGNGPFAPTSVLFTADRWQMYCPPASGTLAVSRDTANVDTGSQTCAVIVAAGQSAVNIAQLYQLPAVVSDGGAELQGRTLTVAMRVKASTPAAVRVSLTGGVATPVYSTYHSGGGAYETLVATMVCPAALPASGPTIALNIEAGGTFYLDSVTMVEGTVAGNPMPMHPAEDLVRCQRYYEMITESELQRVGYQLAGGPDDTYIGYKVRKALAPTVTKNGTWNINNCSQPVPSAGGPNGLSLRATVIAAGQFSYSNNSAGCTLTMEANPA